MTVLCTRGVAEERWDHGKEELDPKRVFQIEATDRHPGYGLLGVLQGEAGKEELVMISSLGPSRSVVEAFPWGCGGKPTGDNAVL